MGNPTVKIGNKTPKTSLSPCTTWNPIYTIASADPTHHAPQTPTLTVHTLSHNYAVNSPLVTMRCPTFAHKITLPVDRSPNQTTCLKPGSIRLTTLNRVHIYNQPFCHNALDRQTDRHTEWQTNRLLEGMFDDCRPLLLYREFSSLIIIF